jgi:hypothetical protein
MPDEFMRALGLVRGRERPQFVLTPAFPSFRLTPRIGSDDADFVSCKTMPFAPCPPYRLRKDGGFTMAPFMWHPALSVRSYLRLLLPLDRDYFQQPIKSRCRSKKAGRGGLQGLAQEARKHERGVPNEPPTGHR